MTAEAPKVPDVARRREWEGDRDVFDRLARDLADRKAKCAAVIVHYDRRLRDTRHAHYAEALQRAVELDDLAIGLASARRHRETDFFFPTWEPLAGEAVLPRPESATATPPTPEDQRVATRRGPSYDYQAAAAGERPEPVQDVIDFDGLGSAERT